MAAVPPPEGLGEHDYEAIEAAVTETVRGRWFLNEFARRNRAGELRLLLDAIGRLEATVGANHAALPPADPSIRLLMQRIKEIAGQLDALGREMRAAGVAERFASAVEHEARAVAGMVRGAVGRPALPPAAVDAQPLAPQAALPPAPPPPEPAAPEAAMPEPAAAPEPATRVPADDPRLAALLELDRLPLTEKLALFS